MNKINNQNDFIEFFINVFAGLSKEEKISISKKIKDIKDIPNPKRNLRTEIFIGSGGFLGTYSATNLDKKSNKFGIGFTKEKAINSLLINELLK